MTAGTINCVINNIYHAGQYNKIIRDMLWNQNRLFLFDDYKAEIMTAIISHKNPDMIIKLYNTNQFLFWFIRLCENNIKSKNSPLYYKYIKPNQNTESIQYDMEDVLNETNIDYQKAFEQFKEVIDQMSLISRKYKNAAEIYRLKYLYKYKIREITEKLSISERTVNYSLKIAKEYINQHFNLNKFKSNDSSSDNNS